MKRTFGTLLTLLTLLVLVAPADAVLVNHGPHGEYFQDTETGLYWFDPMIFRASVRIVPDAFATHAANWGWATGAQVDGLLGKTSTEGVHLEEVMGERFSTIGAGGPRWLGFHSLPTEPDGWIAQSNNPPAFDEITATGYQGGAAAQTPGSWMISSIDPVIGPRLWNAGPAGELFYDEGTGLYWQDPDNFAGQPRADIQIWLDGNPVWRWATEAEIYSLQGIHTRNDAPLEEIMGLAQYAGVRWIGFFEDAGTPDGRLIGTSDRVDYALLVYAGTQGGAGGWGAGAWILTDSIPTGIDSGSLGDADWGAVKRLFR